MKKYIYAVLVVGIAGLLCTTRFLWKQNKNLTEWYGQSKNNEKALLLRNDSVVNKVKVLQLTIEQLNYYNDFLIEDLKHIKDSLKVKDKKLKNLQYLSSTASKADTICFRDTIFQEKVVQIDTLLTDSAWYELRMSLSYPNKLVVQPLFSSKKYVVISTKRETVNPPKKFFLFRWFQKKHTVVEATIVEKNPYIKNDENQFIEIVK